MNCRYLDQCGGCRYAYDAYNAQDKRQILVKGFPKVKADPVLTQDPFLHYRHKVYATFGKDRRGRMIMGLYEEKSHRLVPVEDCMIQCETANAILKTLRDTVSAMHIEPYDEDRRTGSLRHAYIRVSRHTGDVLLVLVSGTPVLPGSRELVKRVREKHPEIRTVILNINSRRTSAVLGDKEHILYGKGWITDRLCGIDFRISSRSFFQVNPEMTEVLYRKAMELADLKETDTVLDACCGTGTITLIASRYAGKCTGVEINPSAVRDARHSASANGITNVRCVCDDVEHYMSENHGNFSVLFLDPPRSGVTEAFIRASAEMNPRKIVYISCNPETLIRDVHQYQRLGYRIRKVCPIDLFPLTEHVETIVLMSRKDT